MTSATCVLLPLGITLSQPYSTFVFCTYAKVIFSGSKQTHFLYNSAEDSRPVPGSVSPCSDFHKDRTVGLHSLDCLQAEHKVQPSGHASVVSELRARAGAPLQALPSAPHHCRASAQGCRKTRGGNCFSIPREQQKTQAENWE